MSDISVIVPVYNVQDFLEPCLDSIAAQILKPKEVLLVNDGSTDGSRDICRRYSDKYAYMRIIDQVNRGQSAARNTGLDKASGDFVVFIDSDDYVSENMFAVLHDKAVQSGADIVKCGIRFLFDDGSMGSMKGIDQHELILNNREEFFRALLENRFNPSICNAIYRKELFGNIRFDVGKLMEDSFLTPYLLLSSRKIITIPDEFYFYRQREGSTMHTFSDRHFDLIEFIHDFRELLKRNQLYETFRDSFYTWSGYHFMITIKNAARHSTFLQYIKHVEKFHRLVPDTELENVILAISKAKQETALDKNRTSSLSKAVKTIQTFRKNPNLFWLKTKINQWKKHKKNSK